MYFCYAGYLICSSRERVIWPKGIATHRLRTTAVGATDKTQTFRNMNTNIKIFYYINPILIVDSGMHAETSEKLDCLINLITIKPSVWCRNCYEFMYAADCCAQKMLFPWRRPPPLTSTLLFPLLLWWLGLVEVVCYRCPAWSWAWPWFSVS